MQQKTLMQSALIIFGSTAILYPLYILFNTLSLPDIFTLEVIFPALGLLAFSIMWLHIIGSPFETRLRTYINYEKWISISSAVVLVAIILHPLLIFIHLGFDHAKDVFLYGNPIFVSLGFIGLIMLLTYDIEKMFRKRAFFIKYKGVVNVISTLGFFVILFHSLGLGGELQTGALRIIWIGYGITAGIATLNTWYRAIQSRKIK